MGGAQGLLPGLGCCGPHPRLRQAAGSGRWLESKWPRCHCAAPWPSILPRVCWTKAPRRPRSATAAATAWLGHRGRPRARGVWLTGVCLGSGSSQGQARPLWPPAHGCGAATARPTIAPAACPGPAAPRVWRATAVPARASTPDASSGSEERGWAGKASRNRPGLRRPLTCPSCCGAGGCHRRAGSSQGWTPGGGRRAGAARGSSPGWPASPALAWLPRSAPCALGPHGSHRSRRSVSHHRR